MWRLDTDATGEKLEDADVVVTRATSSRGSSRTRSSRAPCSPFREPPGDFTLYSATQVPHILRVLAAATLGLHESKLRVVAPDVGGGFGSKLDVYAEELLALALARRLDPPVKWVEERSENYLATIHGRDVVTEYTLAATKDGTITHCRRSGQAAMGAYLQLDDAGDPAPRGLDLRRPVRHPELQRRVHRRVHEHDADRRLSRGRKASPRRPT